MKRSYRVGLLVALLGLGLNVTRSASIDLAVLAEVDLGQPIGQLRAVPVELGQREPKAVAALYSSDAEIDPYIGMFFFPKSTLKLVNRAGEQVVACFPLPKGNSHLEWS